MGLVEIKNGWEELPNHIIIMLMEVILYLVYRIITYTKYNTNTIHQK